MSGTLTVAIICHHHKPWITLELHILQTFTQKCTSMGKHTVRGSQFEGSYATKQNLRIQVGKLSTCTNSLFFIEQRDPLASSPPERDTSTGDKIWAQFSLSES